MNEPKLKRVKKQYDEVFRRQADCLFEIGRVHFHEGAPDSARRFLLEALPLAQQAEALRGEVADDRLEGRIAELLLQLPDEEQELAV